MAELSEFDLAEMAFEAEFADIQVKAVAALAGAQNAPKPQTVTKVLDALIERANEGFHNEIVDRMNAFEIAFNQFVIEKNLKAVKTTAAAAIVDTSALKLATKIAAEGVKGLILPSLLKGLERLYTILGALNDAAKKVIALGVDDDVLAKRQKELDTALKAVDDEIKKQNDANKKNDDAGTKKPEDDAAKNVANAAIEP